MKYHVRLVSILLIMTLPATRATAGLLDPVIFDDGFETRFDLTAPPEIYWTWDPPADEGPGFAAVNEGSAGIPSNYAYSPSGGLTIGTAYGKVKNGVILGGNAGGLNMQGTIVGWGHGHVATGCAWVRFASNAADNVNRFPMSQNNSFGGWWLQRGESPYTLTLGVEGPTGGSATSTTQFLEGVWHHVAWVMTGTELLIYVDGVLEGTAPGEVADSFSTPNQASSGWPRFGVEWYGNLDEILWFYRVLTPAEVKNIYKAGVAGRKVTWE